MARPCRREKDPALNVSLHPTQRRLVIALVVTVACLPLLVLDLLGGQGGAATDASVVDTEVQDPSMVVAVSPSEATTSTTAAPSTTVTTAPPTTAATTPPTTVKKTPSTTAAPKAATKAAPPTTAPKVSAPPAPAGPTPTAAESAFLACVRHRESRGNYGAVDPSGQFMGAYQIYQGGWDAVAQAMGRSDLVGRKPNTVAPADQDAVALAMLRMYGKSPWGPGSCG